MPPPTSDFFGGGGDAQPSSSADSSAIWHQWLPKTVGEVKKYSTAHTQFENRGLADDFAFTLWCVLVPRPISEDSYAGDQASRFLIQHRESFGNSLADNVLLVTKVKENGALDFGFAADVKHALEYNDTELPALLFVREPQIRIYRTYKNVELLNLRNRPLNGLNVTLGECSTDAVRRFLEKLPPLLEGENVPVDELAKLLNHSESAAKRAEWAQTAKKVGEVAVPLITVISTILKVCGYPSP